MEKVLLNYKVFIEKDNSVGKKPVYVSHVPTLGISDYGNSLEETIKRTESLIKFHVECLVDEGLMVPEPDSAENIFVTFSKVEFTPKKKLSFI